MVTWKYATLYIQAEHEVLRPDDGLEHAKIFVGRLTLDRCLVETAEGMHDELIAFAGGRMNSRSGEEVFAPRSKVLIRSDPSVLEKILNREIHILWVDEFRRRRFRRKGKTLLELDIFLIPFPGNQRRAHFVLTCDIEFLEARCGW
jgi:hypothetical protein